MKAFGPVNLRAVSVHINGADGNTMTLTLNPYLTSSVVIGSPVSVATNVIKSGDVAIILQDVISLQMMNSFES